MTMCMVTAFFLWSLLLVGTAARPTNPSLRPQKPVDFVFPSATAPAVPPPTKPASSPTKPPPTRPSGSGFSISTDKSTYTFNSTVFVSFTNSKPRKDDFVAIYRVSTPSNSLWNGLFWLYTCNQRQGTGCPNAISEGTVTFGPKGINAAWGINWPLPAGQYRAYLVRNSDKPPFTAIAKSDVFSVVQSFEEALSGAKAALTTMVTANFGLIPQFLRLIFHDCIGGCDGCIDMTNHENSGLETTIDVLTLVTDAYANNVTGLTRADVWSMSAIVAADNANKAKINVPVNFTYDWVGRVNCEDANHVCKNAGGAVVTCGPKAGPSRNTPGPNLNSTGFFSFFDREYGFSQDQAIVAMGGHSVGRLFRQNSGIDGPDGWESHNRQLHSEYYEALLGSVNSRSNGSYILDKSPKWHHMFLNNTKFNRPDRFFWRLSIGNKNLTMLNADMSMVRTLDNSNMDPVTGKVSCGFTPTLDERPLCPLAPTLATVKKMVNNDVWLAAFKSVLDLVSTNGYKRKSCSKKPCRLVPQ